MRSARLGRAEVRFTEVSDGDFAPPLRHDDDDGLAERRARVAPGPWTWLRQVHGVHVVVAGQPGDHAGATADAALAVAVGSPVAVVTADCAPIVLADRAGAPVVAAVHAGWRGLLQGIVETSVEQMRSRGATEPVAALGPCIHAECYEFSLADLDVIAARFGDAVRSSTQQGAPALDLPAAVGAALRASGAELIVDADECTSCSPRLWSHRGQRAVQRQATVAWLE